MDRDGRAMLVLWTSRGAGSSAVWSRSSSAWPSGGLHSSSSLRASCFWLSAWRNRFEVSGARFGLGANYD